MDIQAELIRPAIERLDGRICVSEACIGSLTPYFPYAYDVIPNGIDADHFSPDAEPVAELMGDHRNIVFVGRFDPRNGVDTMIRAHQLLFAERGPAVRLIVVGDGPLRRVYERDGERRGAALRPLRRAGSTAAARTTWSPATCSARRATGPRSGWCCWRR